MRKVISILTDLQRYEALLEMADLVVHHHNLPELFVALAGRLRRVAAADAANFSLYDPIKNVMCLHLWEGQELVPTAAEVPVEESPSGWAWQNQQPLVVSDLTADSRFPPVLRILRDKGLRSYCWLPLTTAQKRLGTPGSGQFSNQRLRRKRHAVFAAGCKVGRRRGRERAHTRGPGAGKRKTAHAAGGEQHAGYKPRLAKTVSRDFRVYAPHDPVRLRQRRGL